MLTQRQVPIGPSDRPITSLPRPAGVQSGFSLAVGAVGGSVVFGEGSELEAVEGVLPTSDVLHCVFSAAALAEEKRGHVSWLQRQGSPLSRLQATNRRTTASSARHRANTWRTTGATGRGTGRGITRQKNRKQELMLRTTVAGSCIFISWV